MQPLSPELSHWMRHGYEKEMRRRSECSKYLSHMSVIQLDIVSDRRCLDGGWSAVQWSPFGKCCRAFSVVASAKTFPVPGTNQQKPVHCTSMAAYDYGSWIEGRLFSIFYLQTLHNLPQECRDRCLSTPCSGALWRSVQRIRG